MKDIKLSKKCLRDLESWSNQISIYRRQIYEMTQSTVERFSENICNVANKDFVSRKELIDALNRMGSMSSIDLHEIIDSIESLPPAQNEAKLFLERSREGNSK